MESLDSTGPSSKRSKDESLAEDDSSAPWEYKPTREEQKMEKLQKELAATKEKLQTCQATSLAAPVKTAGSQSKRHRPPLALQLQHRLRNGLHASKSIRSERSSWRTASYLPTPPRTRSQVWFQEGRHVTDVHLWSNPTPSRIQ